MENKWIVFVKLDHSIVLKLNFTLVFPFLCVHSFPWVMLMHFCVCGLLPVWNLEPVTSISLFSAFTGVSAPGLFLGPTRCWWRGRCTWLVLPHHFSHSSAYVLETDTFSRSTVQGGLWMWELVSWEAGLLSLTLRGGPPLATQSPTFWKRPSLACLENTIN